MSYGAALEGAVALQTAIKAFSLAPSAAGLDACRTAWLAAREAYSPTEVYRFVGGPIDAEPANLEVKINGWPLDEQWLDYTRDTPASGIINAVQEYPAFTGVLLAELNEKGGEKNIATGFHALEFLLWGQDGNPTGPGARPFTDFVAGGTAAQQERRRAYLVAAVDLLVEQLAAVRHQWAPTGTYRAAFIADPATGLKQALTGAIMLAGDELSGERLAVAYETQDQEEEQSCFSDNTHRDTIRNIEGVRRVWLGHFDQRVGPGLQEVVAAKNPEVASRTTARIEAAFAAAKSIPVPFDQAILGRDGDPGRAAVLLTIQELENAADELVAAAKVVGIDIEFGANANNAIVGIKDLQAHLPRIVAAVQANDAAAAKAGVDVCFDRWLRFETAISREAPTDYKRIESAMNAVKNEAVRAKKPDVAKVTAATTALSQALEAVLPKLKTE